MEVAQEKQHGKSSSGMALTGVTSSTVTHPTQAPSPVKLKAPLQHHCYPATPLSPHPAPNHCCGFSVRKEKETRHRKEQAENNFQWFSKSNIICFIYLVAWWYVLFLLSVHFNMNKLFLCCLNSITGITRGKEASSLKHKQEPRKQNRLKNRKEGWEKRKK